MEDDFAQQARKDFIAAGRQWPPFQRNPPPTRFSLDAARAWWAFHAGFGTFTITLPDMKARRRWLIGKSALLYWQPKYPAKRACFHFYRRHPDGLLAFRAEWRALSFNWRPSWLDKVIDTTGAT